MIPQLIILLTTYVVIMMFFFPAIGFIAILLHGPMALASVWFIITQISVTISNVFVLKLLMPEIEKITFDAVLSKHYNDDVVMMGKLRRISKVPFIIKCQNYIGALPEPWILPFLVLRAVLVFVMSFIPIIGPLILAYVKAPTRGLQSHQRYFALRGFDAKQIKSFYKQRRGEYIGFGLVANLLESIPILNLLFMFTNTLGGALWVVQIEADLKSGKSELDGVNEVTESLNLPLECLLQDVPKIEVQELVQVGIQEPVQEPEVGVSSSPIQSKTI